MSERTDLCDHSKEGQCVHCLEGCTSCGELVDLNDDSYCEECALDRACYAADMMHDMMKEGS